VFVGVLVGVIDGVGVGVEVAQGAITLHVGQST